MSTLYVTEMGVQVHKEGQRLLVKRGEDVLQDIPMIKIDRVVMMGKGASITTPTLYALTQRKVGIYFLSSRGKFLLRTVGEEHHHSRLRQAQMRACDDPARSLTIARGIVNGKVGNQRVLVQRHAEGAPGRDLRWRKWMRCARMLAQRKTWMNCADVRGWLRAIISTCCARSSARQPMGAVGVLSAALITRQQTPLTRCCLLVIPCC